MPALKVVSDDEGIAKFQQLTVRDLKKTIGWLEGWRNLCKIPAGKAGLSIHIEQLKHALSILEK